MNFKYHIFFSVIISLVLLAIISCQIKEQNSQSKEQSKGTKTQTVNKNNSADKEVGNGISSENAKVKSNKFEETKTESNKKTIEEVGKNSNSKEEEMINRYETSKKVDGTKKAEKVYKEDKTIAENIKKNDDDTILEDAIQPIAEKERENLFLNSDFSEGLNNWSYDENVNFFQEDGKNHIEITGSKDKQTRIWQNINTISGHVYRLSFKAKGQKYSSFAIFRDNAKCEERYLFTEPSDRWKGYQKDFPSFKNGDYEVFLSCQGKGVFYFSDISVVDVTEE
jgi:hypothetical protein